jgi:pyrroline-5-carboxylate reductase
MSISKWMVGGGKMGSAIVAGWLRRGADPDSIHIIELDPARRQEIAERYGITPAADIDQLSDKKLPSVIVLALKPSTVLDVLPLYQNYAQKGVLMISVAAGIRLSIFENGLGRRSPIIRAMPNTPAEIGRGTTVLCANSHVGVAHKTLSEELMRAIGTVYWVEDENLMDAVTAISGSGPAYLFLFAEYLAQAGMRAGLPADLADRLARETLAGASELLLTSAEAAAQLRENVTSTGGTTAAALSVLMANTGLRPLLEEAVAAAKARSQEMAK